MRRITPTAVIKPIMRREGSLGVKRFGRSRRGPVLAKAGLCIRTQPKRSTKNGTVDDNPKVYTHKQRPPSVTKRHAGGPKLCLCSSPARSFRAGHFAQHFSLCVDYSSAKYLMVRTIWLV